MEVSADTADLLIKAGFSNCVKVKKEPVKAALKNFDAAQQKKFHINLVPGEESFYCKAAEKKKKSIRNFSRLQSEIIGLELSGCQLQLTKEFLNEQSSTKK